MGWINAVFLGWLKSVRRPRGIFFFFTALLVSAFHSRATMILDPSFDSGPGLDVFSEHVVPLVDGKILVCGHFHTYNSAPAPYIMRLNEDGTLDPTFRIGVVGDWIRHMIVQPDGKIVVGGAFTNAGGVSRNLIARLNADGSLDASFDPGTGFEEKIVPPDPNPPLVFWMALQPDGKVLCVGSFAKFNGRTVNGIARLNPDGSLDTTFQAGSGFDSWGRFVLVQPDNHIIVSGWFTDYNGFACNRLIRLHPDGTPDGTFRPYFGDKTAIYSAAPLGDGGYIVSGHSKSDFGLFKREIARLNPDGSQDDSFLAHTDNRTESILLQPDGKFLACGWFDMADDQTRWRIARFNADGSLDESFVANADFFVWNMAFDAKGRLLAVGGFPSILGATRLGIARLMDDSTLPTPPVVIDPGNPPASSGAPATNEPPVRIAGAGMWGNAFEVQIQTATNGTYYLEQRSAFTEGAWKTIDSLPGNGALRLLFDMTPGPVSGCYRVRVE